MISRLTLFGIILTALFGFVSCAHVSKRMPSELNHMHKYLTQDNPTTCQNYHYNYERQAPRLYNEKQVDSLLDVIEYIKTECGPNANLDVTRTLILSDMGQFDDSLLGSATIPQMLWHRAEQERIPGWRMRDYIYGLQQQTDNSHDSFLQFRVDLAKQVASNNRSKNEERALGQFYSGKFDSAFSLIQSDEMRESKLRETYDDYITQTKSMFPSRGNIGLLIGSWRPNGSPSLLGNHPEIGVQLGGENKHWRIDGILCRRFTSAKNEYFVDSLGQIVATDNFDSWFAGVEGGYKFFENATFSSDIFFGLAYDVMYSASLGGDPEEHVSHSTLAPSIGLRQRIFINRSKGFYLGASVRYTAVDYKNPGGTDLSGNSLTISFITGWSFHETLNQFLKKLNYKGNWRP